MARNHGGAESSPSSDAGENSGDVGPVVGDGGRGEVPGRVAGLLRWLARAGRARCGRSVAGQRTLRGGGGAERGGRRRSRVQWRLWS